MILEKTLCPLTSLIDPKQGTRPLQARRDLGLIHTKDQWSIPHLTKFIHSKEVTNNL